jgi:pantetheine-phosphate adenylyltransferase
MLIAITGRMAIGKSTIIQNMSLSVPHVKFDLDKAAHKYSQSADIQEFIESNRSTVDQTTKDICWKNIFSESNKYRQFCALYEPYLIKEVQEIIHFYQFSDAIKIVEASALYAYPKLRQLFDAVIELGTTAESREENIESRADLANERFKVEIADALYVSCGTDFLNIGLGKNPSMILSKLITKLYRRLNGQHVSRAYFCGSFEPMTIGHYDIYERACEMFDEVIFVKAKNPSKSDTLRESPKYLQLVTTTYIPTLLRGESGVTNLIRGVRTEKDYVEAIEWFRSIEIIVGSGKVELILLPASKELENVSSTFVRALEKLSENDAKRFIVPNHFA